ncbi:hypothetical protein RJT34_28970 [Clitoria ternatea]|uniref:Uncharacterized protein n=1 Tax=Clitoria ternatea TaxID=43366 RepID=A0AAN9FFN3_CLITE
MILLLVHSLDIGLAKEDAAARWISFNDGGGEEEDELRTEEKEGFKWWLLSLDGAAEVVVLEVGMIRVARP